MKESTQQLLAKAVRASQASQSLLDNGFAEFATGRAYYAMFYIAEALLNELDLRFSKHGGVHGAFGEHFVKTGVFDPKFHRWLLDAFDQRIDGDYGIEVSVNSDDPLELIAQVQEFYEAARVYLEKKQD